MELFDLLVNNNMEHNHNYVYLLDQIGVDHTAIKVCVETGTHRGLGVFTFSMFFDKVYTIELSKELYDFSREKYKDEDKISFLHGKSTDLLEAAVKDIKQPYFLFLDAHGSGGDTTFDVKYGNGGSPVLEELECVKSNPPAWIVIDDLHEFETPVYYPSTRKVTDKVSEVGDYENLISLRREGYHTGGHQWGCFKKK